LNDGAGWRCLPELSQESIERIVRAFDLNENALGRIGDPSGDLGFAGEPKDMRPKTHTLHGAANNNTQALEVARRGQRRDRDA
jgi:hypothetical protein